MACACGGRRTGSPRIRTAGADRRDWKDPTQTAFSMQPRYVVMASQTARTGKRFTSLQSAQDYARRTGGIVRQL